MKDGEDVGGFNLYCVPFPFFLVGLEDCSTEQKTMIDSKIELIIILGENAMPRISGDKNHSIREQRLVAEKEALKAEVKALKAKIKAKDCRIRELGARV